MEIIRGFSKELLIIAYHDEKSFTTGHDLAVFLKNMGFSYKITTTE